MELKTEIIKEIQKLRSMNKSIIDISNYLIKELNLNEESRFIVISYLIEALKLEIKDISEIGAWNFFNGGTLSDEEIDNKLNKLIHN